MKDDSYDSFFKRATISVAVIVLPYALVIKALELMEVSQTIINMIKIGVLSIFIVIAVVRVLRILLSKEDGEDKDLK